MERVMDNLIEYAETCGHESNEFYLHSACHTSSPTWIRWKNGIYDLICAECEKVIVRNIIPPGSQEISNN